MRRWGGGWTGQRTFAEQNRSICGSRRRSEASETCQKPHAVGRGPGWWLAGVPVREDQGHFCVLCFGFCVSHANIHHQSWIRLWLGGQTTRKEGETTSLETSKSGRRASEGRGGKEGRGGGGRYDLPEA
jgi:hypothetical protein